jgi:hypothetical protein
VKYEVIESLQILSKFDIDKILRSPLTSRKRDIFSTFFNELANIFKNKNTNDGIKRNILEFTSGLIFREKRYLKSISSSVSSSSLTSSSSSNFSFLPLIEPIIRIASSLKWDDSVNYAVSKEATSLIGFVEDISSIIYPIPPLSKFFLFDPECTEIVENQIKLNYGLHESKFIPSTDIFFDDVIELYVKDFSFF